MTDYVPIVSGSYEEAIDRTNAPCPFHGASIYTLRMIGPQIISYAIIDQVLKVRFQWVNPILKSA
jgi:hypothetical protein